ncbi:MAG: universal stress protein [Candidatus Sulfotelmatobacter sp.]
MPTVPQVARLSLKKILVPTDFSTASRAALPFARALAEVYGSTILVAHSIAPQVQRPEVADHFLGENDQAWHDARHQLDEFMRDRLLAALPCTTLLDRGDVAEVIPAIIHEHEVDLVVVGTHGRHGVGKLILGSAAEKIYRTATCPVLTVGPKVQHADHWQLRRILCPLDVAEDPEPVLHYALSLAEENQAEFIVLQAVPLVPWQHRPSVEERCWRAIEGLIPEHAKDWCTPQIVVRWEHPAEAIVREAQERAVDLIVMSVHKSRAASWSSHLPWPVASEVVSRAVCPVLTIRV